MKRQAVYFADDILVEEIISMARDHGMHVRIRDNAVYVDRVPNIVRKDHLTVVTIERKVKS